MPLAARGGAAPVSPRALLTAVARLWFARCREEHNQELLARVAEQTKELAQTKADQADVYVYLHKKLDDNFDVIAGLEAKILDLEADKDRLAGSMQRELAAAARAAEAEKEELQHEVAQLNDQLMSLNEFKEHKDAIEASMARLRAELEAEKKAHEEEVAELGRRNVAAKDKLKKEMFLKIKETKKNILSSTEDQLHDTTKRTMAENSQMSTELQYQSKETEKLIGLNARLAEENAELLRERSLSDQTQQELVKRTHFYQRLIKKLNERIKVAEEREREANDRVAKHEEALATAEELKEVKEELAHQERKYRDLRQLNEAMRREMDEREEEYQRWVALQDETVKFLLISVDDIKKTGGRRGAPKELGQKLDALPPAERERALQLLLAKMQLFQNTMAQHQAMAAHAQAASQAQALAASASAAASAGGGSPGVGVGSSVSLPPIGVMGSVGGGYMVGPGASVSLESVGAAEMPGGVGASASHLSAPFSVPSTLAPDGSLMMMVPPKPPGVTVGVQTMLTGARPPLPGDLGAGRGSDGNATGAGGRTRGGGKEDAYRSAEAVGPAGAGAGEAPSHFFSAYDNFSGPAARGHGGASSKFRASTLGGAGATPSRGAAGHSPRAGSSARRARSAQKSLPDSRGGARDGDDPRVESSPRVPRAPAGHAKPSAASRPGPLQSGVGFSNDLSSLMGRPSPVVGTDLGIVGVHKQAGASPEKKKHRRRRSRESRPV